MYEPKILNGYRLIYMPTYPKALKHSGYKGYVYEHIYVVEQSLGRLLAPNEDVHHLDGIRSNNRISNLLVLSHGMHSRLHCWLKSVEIVKKQVESKTCPCIKHSCDKQPCTTCYCTICGKLLSSVNKKYCSKKCQAQAQSKRPLQKELEQLWLIQKLNVSNIGRYYGVSHTAIRRWLKFYNLIQTDG